MNETARAISCTGTSPRRLLRRRSRGTGVESGREEKVVPPCGCDERRLVRDCLKASRLCSWERGVRPPQNQTLPPLEEIHHGHTGCAARRVPRLHATADQPTDFSLLPAPLVDPSAKTELPTGLLWLSPRSLTPADIPALPTPSVLDPVTNPFSSSPTSQSINSVHNQFRSAKREKLSLRGDGGLSWKF